MATEFDWEQIEDYQHLTGIEPIDKALAYDAFEGLLQQHLVRREQQHGREAVIADLEALVAATPPTSPAHEGGSGWLKRYRDGVMARDL